MLPSEYYTARIGVLTQQLAVLEKRKNQVAWGRFFIVLLIALAAWQLFPISLLAGSIVIAALAAAFGRLVMLAADNRADIAQVTRLLDINRQELAIAAGQYTGLPDGHELLPAGHDYAQDLDIMGRASIYQYINRTACEQGHAILSQWLLHPAAANTLLQRQAAARELAPATEWRQELQALGIEESITINTEKRINSWLTAPDSYSGKAAWKILQWGYPIVTLGILLLYIAGFVPPQWFYGGLIVFIAFSFSISKDITPHYGTLDKIMKEIAVLSKSAACIEKMGFQNDYLRQLQDYFLTNKLTASTGIQKLKGILDRFDYRLNPLVFVPLNAFLLWDLQLIFQLEKWRRLYKPYAGQWFTALGEMEAINTIANLHFNQPQWAFAELDTERHGTLEAVALGHPLIADSKRVCSSFSTRGEAKLALITGSNMAGKSTFLRSIGVNVVLAMMGAPACAARLTLSPMRIVSTMRIADNLEESTSTFYAELKKLKYIIECVNRREKVFLLLDEILRGTNSLDRHTGSRALVKQLIQHEATGMLATHDLELAKLENEYPQNIHNYHFDVQVAGEELYFDYKLKEGVCTSLNASVLMRKIGIEM
jgi:hypothetical protein